MRVNSQDHQRAAGDVLLQPARKIQMPFVNHDFPFAASVADVTVGEVRGNAHIEIGAMLKNSEAAWNRAVAVEALNGRGHAMTAWHDYLAIDATSPWAAEARKRIAAD